MPATQAYSPAQAYAVLQTIPRLSRVQAKVIEILEGHLNPAIEYANTALTAAGELAMLTIAPTVYPAPAKISDDYLNSAIVGLAVDYEVRGGGLIDTRLVLSIYLVDKRLDSATDVTRAWDRAAVAVAVLERFAGGCYDDNGNQLWRQLLPLNSSFLPEAWADYSGVAISYEVKQNTTAKQDGGAVSKYWPDAS